MKPVEDMSPVSDERIERLIGRHLDGEITADDQAELDALIASRPDVESLLREYARNDALAAEALECDYECSMGTARPGGRRGYRLATAAVALAAAAAIALSIVPHWIGRGDIQPTDPGWAGEALVDRPASETPPAGPEFADYRDIDFQPRRRERASWREIIGIRDQETGAIYILERDTRSTRLVPVSGDS